MDRETIEHWIKRVNRSKSRRVMYMQVPPSIMISALNDALDKKKIEEVLGIRHTNAILDSTAS